MRALDWRAQVSDGLPWSRLRKKRTSVLQGIVEKAKVALRDHRIEVGGIGVFGRAETLDRRAYPRLVRSLTTTEQRVRAARGDERGDDSTCLASNRSELPEL